MAWRICASTKWPILAAAMTGTEREFLMDFRREGSGIRYMVIFPAGDWVEDCDGAGACFFGDFGLSEIGDLENCAAAEGLGEG